MTTETIVWIPAKDHLPDAETNVLCFDEESMIVCQGFLDGEHEDGSPLWIEGGALRFQLGCVTHWAEMPHGPVCSDA